MPLGVEVIEPATTAMVESAGEAGVHAGSSPADPIRLFGIEDCIRDEAVRWNSKARCRSERSGRNENESHPMSLDRVNSHEPSRFNLGEPTEGRQPAAGCPAGVSASEATLSASTPTQQSRWRG